MDRYKEEKNSMTEYDDLVVYYALHKATPPDCDDEIVNRQICMQLSEAEQRCILEHAETIKPLEKWKEEAATYFDGGNIYYRNSRWTSHSKLVCVDTSTGMQGWLSRCRGESITEDK